MAALLVYRDALALCSLHHKIFDLGAFTVLPGNHQIVFSRHLMGGDDTKAKLLAHHGAGVAGAAYREPLLLRNSRSADEPVQQFVSAYFVVSGNVSEDCGQCADSQRIVKRDGDVMLGRARCCEPQVTACLARGAITDSRQRFRKLRAGQVAREFHAAMTSSRTK